MEAQSEDKRADGTVARALALLDDVSAAGGAARFSELLSRGRYPKATLHRLLRTLTEQRMLSYDPQTQHYKLGLRLLRLAHVAWAQTSLAELARDILDDLSAATGQTIHLAQLDDGQVLYVDKRNARSRIDMYSDAGKIGPAFCTGVGKAMLAFLDEPAAGQALSKQSFHRYTPNTLDRAALGAELARIRTQGFAYDREEHEPGIICVAAPIRDRRGVVLGALSITSATSRSSLAELEAYVPRLGEAVAAIAAAAEARRSPAGTRADGGT